MSKPQVRKSAARVLTGAGYAAALVVVVAVLACLTERYLSAASTSMSSYAKGSICTVLPRTFPDYCWS